MHKKLILIPLNFTKPNLQNFTTFAAYFKKSDNILNTFFEKGSMFHVSIKYYIV